MQYCAIFVAVIFNEVTGTEDEGKKSTPEISYNL